MLCKSLNVASIILILVILLVSSLQTFSTQREEPAVYLSLRGRNYTTNNSAILITQIGRNSAGNALVCHTNFESCCGRQDRNQNRGIGLWFFPNGSQVLVRNRGGDIYFKRGRQIVALNQRKVAEGPTGQYCCVVEDRSRQNQTFCANIVLTLPESPTPARISSSSDMTFSTVTTIIEENHTQNFNGSLSISIEGINTTSTTMSNHTANVGLFIGVGVFLIIAGLLITCSATCIGCAVRHRRKKMKKSITSMPDSQAQTKQQTNSENLYDSLRPITLTTEQDKGLGTQYKELVEDSGVYDYADREIVLHRPIRNNITVCELTSKNGELSSARFVDDGIYY
ncbi:uncharacterized protein LOC135335281 isoform X2 [Halichondria panicea]|uniref:uncharacterized protein LOC135335281 isoform X2 n=1 Tax=Halichondria panicea TaxID=6063 RepID=UPI00312BC86A